MNRQSKEMELDQAHHELQKLEAIERNVLKKGQEVSDSLALKLREARIRYEMAKDDLSRLGLGKTA